VDIPNATVMLIEQAERFGLAQLHQLRGRVGRGAKEGACLLIHEEPLDGLAKDRLDAMLRFSRGEDIARRDLELRGAGDLGGTRQHGAEDLGLLEAAASYPWHARLLDDARSLFAVDRALARPEHRVLGSIVRRLEHTIAVREEAG
jgi:ATP-dependent DNA helicase RecG